MRYKTNRFLIVGWLMLAGLSLPTRPQDRPPEDDLLREVKLLIFDGQWAPALDKLESILGRYPNSPARSQVLFYRAECLSKTAGRTKEALRAYEEYLRTKDRNESLEEQAEVSIVDLALALSASGDEDAVQKVVDRLSSPNTAVQYYAAYKLSSSPDKAVAAKSIPVLKRIISTETNPELTDRARIALLRVSPKSLEAVDRRPESPKTRILHLQIFGEGTEKIDISIPLSLADLALQAISQKNKDMLRRKGYDLDRILGDLEKAGGSVLEIRDSQEGRAIKIWIETRK